MDITQLLAQAVENLSNGEYVSSGSEILSVKNKQLVLFNDQTPADYEIKNGDVLMMMWRYCFVHHMSSGDDRACMRNCLDKIRLDILMASR